MADSEPKQEEAVEAAKTETETIVEAAPESAPSPDEGDPSVVPPTEASASAAFDLTSETAKAVLKQVEFYFSDANFVRDQFLREKSQEDSEGFVDIKVLLTFNRLKSLSTDADFIAAVLRQSTSLVVKSDGVAVRRATPPPGLNDSLPRSVFADGFSKDAELEAIQEIFAAHGTVLYVKMRRIKKTKEFIGSVFVEMDSRETAEAIVAKAAELQWKGEALKRVSMMDSWVEELKASKKRKRSRDDDAGPGDVDDSSSAPVASPAKPALELVKRELTEGLVVFVKGLGEGCQREDIVDAVGEKLKEEVDWTDYRRGEVEAFVRFKSVESAKLGATELEGFTKDGDKEGDIGGHAPEKVYILEGEEEKAYWTKTWDEIDERRKKRAAGGNKRGGRGGRGRGKGYRGGNKRRRH